MRALFAVILLTGLAGGASAQGFNAEAMRCWNRLSPPESRIDACSNVLKSDQLEDHFLPSVLMRRGVAYLDKRRFSDAVGDFDRVIELKPGDAFAYNNRGLAYRNMRQFDRAISDFDKAIALKPDYPAAFSNRGNVYSSLRDYDRAIQDLDRAIALQPGFAAAQFNRGRAYERKRQYREAIRDYDRAIALKPDYARAWNAKAWILATAADDAIRDGAEAVRLAQRAVALRSAPVSIDTLAAAHAEAGDFPSAIREQERAIAMLRKSGRQSTIDEFQSRLELYRSGKPFREK